uniref:GDSL esterase/lipase n=1 Tax=Physcomitrium patens TaxID=3218 RepID=A0A2K1JYK0_PHYPA|nr:GDSL esterase/lipase At1g09390-like isoform X1 [Physcomitrium patens]PNR46603.1 hypothetical protein PHYPA_013722 [Physcomitrium patens]|eukprot:XP_024386131.1 GDSL esterase/lipase At1g09390-like isoform X1 [Physcomitrella patens]
MVKMALAMVELALLLSLMLVMPIASAAGNGFKCPKAFWTFGDSLSDTGNSQTTFPSASRLYPPYSTSFTFRDKPGFNRFSDGRLIVDFISLAFGHPYYGTYAHALNGANYVRGANFAYAGATANATTFVTPIHLNLQVDNFLNFKSKALDTGFYFPDPKGPYQPVWNAFSDGAYYIPEIGGIDLIVATSVLNLPSPVVIASFVPAAVAAVKTAITTLHDSGARLFFIGNTPPQGCNPAQLTQFFNRTKDALLCVDDINAINRAYGAALQQALEDLRTSLGGDGTQIFLMDNYNASIEIFTNPATYGKFYPTLSQIKLSTGSFIMIYFWQGLPTLSRRVVAPEDPTTTTRPSRAATSGHAARGSRRARRPGATFPGMGFITLKHSTGRSPSSSSMASLSLRL